MLQLRHDRKDGNPFPAARGRADNPIRGNAIQARNQSLKEKRVSAGPTPQLEARARLEADLIRDLAFQRTDILDAIGRGARRRTDAVFAGVESQALGQVDGIGAGDGGAETLDGGEDLLVEVPFYIWHQGRGGGADILWGKGAFGGGVAGGDAGGRGGGHDVGDHVVDADRFARGEGTEGDLDLGHAVWIGVLLGVLAEFLLQVRSATIRLSERLRSRRKGK